MRTKGCDEPPVDFCGKLRNRLDVSFLRVITFAALPLLQRTNRRYPRSLCLAANHLSDCKKASADAFSTISRWTALDVAQAKIAPQAFVGLFLPYLSRKGSNRSR